MKKIIFSSIFIFLLVFVQSGTLVRAEQNDLRAILIKKSATSAALIEQEKANLKASASAAKQARKDALSEVKVTACQNKQAAIQKRSSSIVARATNQQALFSKLAINVENYYQTKLVPAGKTISNYDALVASVSASQAAIAPLLATAQADASSFSCDKDHPADQIKTFNTDMKAVIVALETYRKSVKDLIVGIRTVTGQENSATKSAIPVTQ